MVRKAVDSLLQSVDRLVTRRTYRAAREITGDEQLAAQLAGDAALTPDERATISELTETVVQQYAPDNRHLPLVMLCVTVAGYGGRAFYVLNQLEEIARNSAAKNPAPAKPAEPPAK